MATWPDLTEYHEAVQHPQRTFSDEGLKIAKLELDRFGMPKPATGGNAVVYQATEPKSVLGGKHKWAIRCFLRPISDHAERYDAISKHLKSTHLHYSCKFVFLRNGVLIRKDWFPVVKMQWVEGELFHNYVEKCLRKPQAMLQLRGAWSALVRDLEAANVAHGDLQHGNILVQNGKIVLVDYDGMWVPALKGRKATEIGHRAYQHPQRSEHDYGPHLDRFSSLVIFLSIAALEKNPKLWDEYHTGDNLIFVREDFVNPGNTPVWKSLSKINSPGINYLMDILKSALQKRAMDSPELAAVTNKLYQLKPSSSNSKPGIQPIASPPPKVSHHPTPAPQPKATPQKKTHSRGSKKTSKLPDWMD